MPLAGARALPDLEQVVLRLAVGLARSRTVELSMLGVRAARVAQGARGHGGRVVRAHDGRRGAREREVDYRLVARPLADLRRRPVRPHRLADDSDPLGAGLCTPIDDLAIPPQRLAG